MILKTLFISVLFVSQIGHASPKINTCFSPHENCQVKLIEFIRSAQSSIDVAIFSITNVQIVKELVQQSKKITVRMVIDKSQSIQKNSLALSLFASGISMKFGSQQGIMHNKFMIIDHQKIETGSFNYSEGAVHRNRENQIYLEDKNLSSRFSQEFEELWDSGSPIILKNDFLAW